MRGAGPGRAERVRSPRPLIAVRLPSGRGATEQPNAGPDGAAELTVRFWFLVVATGLLAGAGGMATMALLRLAQRVAYGDAGGDLELSALHATSQRIAAVLLIVGACAGPAWWLLRRMTPGEASDVDDAVWTGGQLSPRRCLGTSTLSEIVVGAGASLGREAAPKLLGGLAGSALARRVGLTVAQRRLLMACGAGAGFAAVYNVPFGGALFTAEVLCGSVALPTVLPALACTLVATVTAWAYLGDGVTYPHVPSFGAQPSLVVWAVLGGPVLGVLASGYVRVIGWLSHHRVRGRAALFAPLLALAVLAAAAVSYPQLLGNGKVIAHEALLSQGGLGLLLVLAVLKPVVTALCLASGMSGGLFTPVLCTGAALGGGLGAVWSMLWPGVPVGAFALVGAAALVGSAMQAPLAGVVLLCEMTGSGFGAAVPMLVAALLATLVGRHIDGYSIYSARLPERPPPLV